MESFFIKILDDYHSCNKDTCKQCSANVRIDPTYETTYCMLLREQGARALNEILVALGKAL